MVMGLQIHQSIARYVRRPAARLEMCEGFTQRALAFSERHVLILFEHLQDTSKGYGLPLPLRA